MIRFNRFKNGTKHVVTMSYDDANVLDKRLIKLLYSLHILLWLILVCMQLIKIIAVCYNKSNGQS